MVKKKIIIVSIFLLAFSGTADAIISVLKVSDGITVTFDAQTLVDPIGCVYIDSLYLTRLTPGEINVGSVIVDTVRFSKKLEGKSAFRVAIFIEGYEGNELTRQVYAGEFNNTLNFLGEAIIDTKLQNFVFKRFTELQQIRAKIKEEGALWKADLTSVFMLPDEDRVKLCGFRAPQTKGEYIPPQPKDSGRQFPPYLDWTNKDGVNWMTRVKDQGPAGTCWAFAGVGQAEALINIVTNTPNPNFDLAEQTVVSDCCRYCGDCAGGMHFWVLMYARNNGIPSETFDPYRARNGPCCKRPSKLWKIKSYSCVTWQDTTPAIIKNALQYHPLSTAVFAPTSGSWDWRAYTGGVYSYGGPATNPNHCVVFVGWNDNDEGGTQTWKIKNSWGEDWGENGYMRLKRGQNNHCGWYTFDADYEP